MKKVKTVDISPLRRTHFEQMLKYKEIYCSVARKRIEKVKVDTQMSLF